MSNRAEIKKLKRIRILITITAILVLFGILGGYIYIEFFKDEGESNIASKVLSRRQVVIEEENEGANGQAESGDTTKADEEAQEEKAKTYLEEKEACKVDEISCKYIGLVVNNALENQKVFYETIKAGAKTGYILVEITIDNGIVVKNAQPYMNKVLTTQLEELYAPKQTGRDAYYVYVAVTIKEAGIYKLGDAIVKTGVVTEPPEVYEFDDNIKQNSITDTQSNTSTTNEANKNTQSNSSTTNEANKNTQSNTSTTN